jgi:hypothetical protein
MMTVFISFCGIGKIPERQSIGKYKWAKTISTYIVFLVLQKCTKWQLFYDWRNCNMTSNNTRDGPKTWP